MWGEGEARDEGASRDGEEICLGLKRELQPESVRKRLQVLFKPRREVPRFITEDVSNGLELYLADRYLRITHEAFQMALLFIQTCLLRQPAHEVVDQRPVLLSPHRPAIRSLPLTASLLHAVNCRVAG